MKRIFVFALLSSCFAACLFLLAGVTAIGAPSSQGESLDVPAPPFVVAVHISSNPEKSEDALEVRAIEEFVSQLAVEVNATGGIKGRALRIAFYNDDLKAEKTKSNVDSALLLPNLMAMIGVWSSTRGAGVVDRIGKNGVPFISEMSVATLFSKYPNIYSLTRSVRKEHEVLANYLRDTGQTRLAFVGTVDDLYTKTYFEHLSGQHKTPGEADSEISLVSTFWLDGEIEDNIPGIDTTIANIKAQNSEAIFLSIRSEPGAKFLKKLTAAGVAVPVYVALGSIQGLARFEGGRDYGGSIIEVAEGGIANLNNERLQQVMRSRDELKSKMTYKPNQIGYGARYQDLLALIVEAARSSPSTQLSDVRASIAGQLKSLRENRRYWRGNAQHWSFSDDRASAERALLVWRPAGKDRSILAPIQYVSQDGKVLRVPVLYVHLDMIRVFGIDSNDKSFEAEFFFTTRSELNVGIEAIEFTNAYRGKVSKDSIINIRKVHEQRGGFAGAGGTHVYRVSGRFRFDPDLARYPFDKQVLEISFQPATTSSAFFLQPSAEQLRGRAFDVDGWNVRQHYVGTSDLIIRSFSGPVMDEYVIPYYTFNYTWVMKRQVIDYILRVIVPLTCILIVSYLAVFIPRVEFNATVAIQVTALLSAIALYFALNQPQADDATLSDLIFVASYAIIALMIALSIFEVNTELVESKRVLSLVRIAQIFLVPLIAVSVLVFLISYKGTLLVAAGG